MNVSVFIKMYNLHISALKYFMNIMPSAVNWAYTEPQNIPLTLCIDQFRQERKISFQVNGALKEAS